MTIPQVINADSSAFALEACRLCDGKTAYRFSKRVMATLDVAYFECQACRSLQTEMPYWLEQAYRSSGGDTANLSDLDTGAAQRNLSVSAAAKATGWLLGLRNVLDFGGGDGLACRLLRDHGFNAFVVDRYADVTYAQGFTSPDFDRPDMVTAFEVMEHFADPQIELAQIFGQDAAAVLISTELYRQQDQDWWYYSEESGQHVFFYSEQAMDLIAERFGYKVVRAGSYTLFVKRMSARARLLSLLLRRWTLPLVRGAIAALPGWGVKRDMETLKQLRNRQPGKKV